MTVAFQRMFGILERWNNNQVTPSLSKPHELSYKSNTSYYPQLVKKCHRPLTIKRIGPFKWSAEDGYIEMCNIDITK